MTHSESGSVVLVVDDNRPNLKCDWMLLFIRNGGSSLAQLENLIIKRTLSLILSLMLLLIGHEFLKTSIFIIYSNAVAD